MKRKSFIYTFVLGSGGLLFHRYNLNAMKLNEGDTQIKMIYNNTGECDGLKKAWGLSVWIENEQGITLFDTGGEAETLEKNAQFLGLDLKKVKQIIISHDHWDHNGGLKMVLEKIDKKPEVYVTSNTEMQYTKDFPNANIIGVSEAIKIDNGIWSTGSLSTDYTTNNLHEHSLVLTRDKSMVLLTGCSHPGIVKIAKKCKEIHPDKTLELITGGFHLMREGKSNVEEISRELKTMDIKRIAPSHCTGDRTIEVFRNDWGDKFLEMNIGDEFTV